MPSRKAAAGAGAQPPSTRKPSRTTSTRDRLLDAAEALFAEHGFHGAPMRDITTQAGTRLADINDHFGSKEVLFQEVVARRALQINADRQARLADMAGVKGRAAQIRAIVEAFAAPLLARSAESQGWRNYLRLLAQLTNSRSLVLVLIAEHFNPIAEVFIEQIVRVLPQLDRRQSLNAYQLMVASSMALFADNGRIDIMSGGQERSDDFASHYGDMVSFVAGGILAIAES